MRRFIKKIVLFSTLIMICLPLLAVFDYFVIGSQYKYGYQASLIDKVDRLVSINEPKIILVGNSNLSFGIHSAEIQEELGMPVVNLGLIGGLGNAYHEQIAKLNINEGDIVVICHSSFSDNDEIDAPELAWITYDFNDSLWPIFRRKDYEVILRAWPKYFLKSLYLWLFNEGNHIPDDCYSRTAFNEYGDVIFKPLDGQMNVDEFFAKTSITVPKINDICTTRLNELNKYCIEHGATMVVAGYPIAYGQYAEFTAKDFENFQEQLEAVLDCDVISNYTDYFYPYDYFYNTAFHLTNDGAGVRTKQLISDLEKWFETDNRQIQ